MISAKLFTNTGDENGTTELPEKTFGEKVNDHVLWLSVCSYLAHQRLGTHSVKNRSAVSGGGRKPFRQKGTGSARQGTRRSPLMPGGGRAFGPQPHKYRVRLNRKVKALGIRCALSLAAKEERVLVMADPAIETPKTKAMAAVLSNMGVDAEKCLFVHADSDPMVYLSGRNLPRLQLTTVEQLNAYDLLNCHKLILTESALNKLNPEGGE